MCELLAFSFNEPVTANISLRMFQKRSKDNPDGWGVAYYPNKAAQVIKEAIPAGKSTLYPLIAKPESLRTKILVAHVRRASVSTITHENTHPFHRELWGREL